MDLSTATSSLVDLLRRSFNRSSSILLHGRAGVGKHTALRRAVAQLSAEQQQRQRASLQINFVDEPSVSLASVLASPKKGEADETAFSFAATFRKIACNESSNSSSSSSGGSSSKLNVILWEDLHICLGTSAASCPSPAACADFTSDLLECLTRALKTDLASAGASNLVIVAIMDTTTSQQQQNGMISMPAMQKQLQLQSQVLHFLSTHLFDASIEMAPPTVSEKIKMLRQISSTTQKLQHQLARSHETCAFAAVELLKQQAGLADGEQMSSEKTATAAASTESKKASSPWDTVVGHDKLKELLQNTVAVPVSRAAELRKRGIAPDLGILLAGAPGCGKTLLARALCESLKQQQHLLLHGDEAETAAAAHFDGGSSSSASSSFFVITAPSLMSAEVGVSERNIVALFADARKRAPSVIFIDEVQAVFRASDASSYSSSSSTATPQHEQRLTTTLLRCMDETRSMFLAGECEAVVVIAATNVPGLVEPALLSHGRLSRVVMVPPPTVKQVQAMVEKWLVPRMASLSQATPVQQEQQQMSAGRWLVDDLIVRWATRGGGTIESFATGADVAGLLNLIELRIHSSNLATGVSSSSSSSFSFASPVSDDFKSLVEQTADRVKPSVSAEANAPIERFFGQRS